LDPIRALGASTDIAAVVAVDADVVFGCREVDARRKVAGTSDRLGLR
jgi:hypothetical protein